MNGRSGYMFSAVTRSLEHTVHIISSKTFDSHAVLESLGTAASICNCCNDNDTLKNALLLICERAKTLYFRILTAYEISSSLHKRCCTEYYERCILAACNALTLFSYFPKCKKSAGEYPKIRRLALARIESTYNNAQQLRFSILSESGKIFLALPALECIYASCNLLSSAKKLIDAYDSVYNKFTLYT